MLRKNFICLFAIIAIPAIIFSMTLISCRAGASAQEQKTAGEVSEAAESDESDTGKLATQPEETAPPETMQPENTALPEETSQTEETIVNGEVTFLTEDGVELKGNIFGQGKKWVILLHMYPTDQTSWFEFAEELAGKGYVALTFDFRGYGNSGGDKDDIGNIDKDILASIDFIKQNYRYEKIFLLGASMGGTASIVAASAAKDESITGVITLAAPDNMGDLMDALAVVSELEIPKLFISAAGDDYHAESAKRLYDSAVEPKAIEIIKGSSEHGTFIFENEPQNAEKLKEIIFNFLNSN